MLTTHDWLARAAEAASATSAAAAATPDSAASALSALAEAEAACRWPDDWLAVAVAWHERGDSAQARRCIEVVLERADGEHGPMRRAAELLLRELSDRPAAVAALDRVAAHLTSSGERVRTYRWLLLARAYREVLSDDDAARRVFAHAVAGATEPDDLADLASGHVELSGDPAAAAATLERAESVALATGQHRELWGIANVWNHALRDPDRARRALSLGVAETSSVRVLASLAAAWRSLFDDDAQVRAALERAESLAATLDDWLEIAEEYFDGGTDNRTSPWDADGVRRALDAGRAVTPPPAAEALARLTSGYRDWLGVSASDAGLPPPFRDPEAEIPRARTFDGCSPGSPRALIDAFRARVTPAGLEAIARSDYGMGWSKHHRVLVEIHATGLVPMPLAWHPLEALELYRWGRGEGVDHALRGFACLVLALDAVGPDQHQIGHIGNALAPLLESCWSLSAADPALAAALESLLVWLSEVIDEPDLPWPLFGLVLTLARRFPSDPRLPALLSALHAAESASAEHSSEPTGWLFRTTNFDTYHDLWRLLASTALASAASEPLVALRSLVAPA